MLTIKKVVVEYKCEVCRAVYDKKSDAQKCEASPVEQKLFKRGDKVKENCSPKCVSKVTMVKLSSPIEDAGDRLNYGGVPDGVHVYEYYVTHTCRVSKREVMRLCFAPQLKPA